MFEPITDPMIDKRREIKASFTPLFRALTSATDEQATPFGINECLLLPAELRDFTVSARYLDVRSAVELC